MSRFLFEPDMIGKNSDWIQEFLIAKILKIKLTYGKKCANLQSIKIKNKKSMSKESTFGMKSQRAVGGGRQYGIPYGMGL